VPLCRPSRPAGGGPPFIGAETGGGPGLLTPAEQRDRGPGGEAREILLRGAKVSPPLPPAAATRSGREAREAVGHARAVRVPGEEDPTRVNQRLLSRLVNQPVGRLTRVGQVKLRPLRGLTRKPTSSTPLFWACRSSGSNRLELGPPFQLCGLTRGCPRLDSSAGVPLGNTATKSARMASWSQRVVEATCSASPPRPWHMTTSARPPGGGGSSGTTDTQVRERPSAVCIRWVCELVAWPIFRRVMPACSSRKGTRTAGSLKTSRCDNNRTDDHTFKTI